MAQEGTNFLLRSESGPFKCPGSSTYPISQTGLSTPGERDIRALGNNLNFVFINHNLSAIIANDLQFMKAGLS